MKVEKDEASYVPPNDEYLYLDNAATTPVDPEVLEEMVRVYREVYGNPSSIHRKGVEAKRVLESARETVAEILDARPEEIVFTGGGSAADNLAIKGVAFRNRQRGKHLITTTIEHAAVRNTMRYLASSHGFDVTFLPVDEHGLVTPEQVAEAIRPDTTLVSVMYANNEIGTIEPIAEIGAVCRERGVYFHTDAVQAFCKVPIKPHEENIDLMAAAAHKIHGPKGVGLLFVRDGGRDADGNLYLDPLVHGGGHEHGLRAGTENVPGIAGFAKAATLLFKNLEQEAKRQAALRDRIIRWVLENVPGSRLNGHPTRRLPNNVNVTFPNLSGRVLLLDLDMDLVGVSTGSACSSQASAGSHVLHALGLNQQQVDGSLRITLGKYTTEEQVDRFLEILQRELAFLADHAKETRDAAG
ncbi:MAG: cysteine desulfurase NifS [Promethearchaeota archaeon]